MFDFQKFRIGLEENNKNEVSIIVQNQRFLNLS